MKVDYYYKITKEGVVVEVPVFSKVWLATTVDVEKEAGEMIDSLFREQVKGAFFKGTLTDLSIQGHLVETLPHVLREHRVSVQRLYIATVQLQDEVLPVVYGINYRLACKAVATLLADLKDHMTETWPSSLHLSILERIVTEVETTWMGAASTTGNNNISTLFDDLVRRMTAVCTAALQTVAYSVDPKTWDSWYRKQMGFIRERGRLIGNQEKRVMPLDSPEQVDADCTLLQGYHARFSVIWTEFKALALSTVPCHRVIINCDDRLQIDSCLSDHPLLFSCYEDIMADIPSVINERVVHYSFVKRLDELKWYLETCVRSLDARLPNSGLIIS